VLAGGASTWAEQASARDRLRSCFLYDSAGRALDADVEVSTADPRVSDNVRSTLDLQRDARTLRAALTSAHPPRLPGPSVDSDVLYWADRVDQRLNEVSTDPRDRREIGVARREGYRRVGDPDESKACVTGQVSGDAGLVVVGSSGAPAQTSDGGPPTSVAAATMSWRPMRA